MINMLKVIEAHTAKAYTIEFAEAKVYLAIYHAEIERPVDTEPEKPLSFDMVIDPQNVPYIPDDFWMADVVIQKSDGQIVRPGSFNFQSNDDDGLVMGIILSGKEKYAKVPDKTAQEIFDDRNDRIRSIEY